jgi:integrase
MKTKSTFGIHFVLKKAKTIDGTAPVYARITVDSSRCEISVKKRVCVNNWNNGKGMAKGSNPEIARLNSYLEQIRSQLTNHYQDLVASKKLVNPEAIKDLFFGIDESSKTLKELIEYHNTHQDENLTWGTLKNYFTTSRYINVFLKKKLKRDDIYLYELNYKFLTDFEYFLRKNKPTDHHRPMGNNAVMKHIERLRKMTNMAIRMEWLDKNPFAAYKLHFKKVERDFLTQEELTAIENQNYSIERLQQVKDMFVFSCYTGLAYIDAMKLGSNNIRKGIDGINWIYTKRKKTSTPVRIPILHQAQELMDKYKNHPKSINKGTIFPIISNQKLNSY